MVMTIPSAITFSVIVPLYNKREHIAAALQSVLNQSRNDFEIIVVDDGSSDGGALIVNDYLNDQRVRLIAQVNMGVSAARNAGISEAVGTYVCFLDADDIWLPNKLDEIRQLFLLYPAAQFAGTSYFEFSELDVVLLEAPDALRIGEPTHELVNDFYARWTKYPFVFTSSIAVRRDTLLHHGLCFPVGESLGEDQDLWFRLCELSPMAFSKKRLTGYRRGLNDHLSNKQPLEILPAYARLLVRVQTGQVKGILSQQAVSLLHKHARDLALANARVGLRLRALRHFRISDGMSPRFMVIFLLELLVPGLTAHLKGFMRKLHRSNL